MGRSHGEEMEEVDHYVEHIKQLSSERDDVLQSLELENRQLKEQVIQLTDDPNATREELAKILEHQGLEEIIDYSRLEQVAFLLAERAQLLDELEALQDQKKCSTKDANIQVDHAESNLNQNLNLTEMALSENSSSKEQNIIEELVGDDVCASNKGNDEDKKFFFNDTNINPCEMERFVSKLTSTEDLNLMQQKEVMDASTGMDDALESDVDLQKLLEKEHGEFEDELHKQQEFWQMNEKKLKDEHEEEVNTVLEENDRLEEELSEARLKMDQYEEQVEELKKTVDILTSQLEQSKSEKSEEPEKVASTPGLTVRRSSDVALRKVIEDKTKVEMELMSLKSQLKNLEHENKSVKSQVDQFQTEAEQERDLQQQLRYRTNSLKTEVEKLEKQLEEKKKSVEKLTREKNASHTQVELLRKEVKDMKVQKEQLETWQDIAEIMSNDKKSLSEKVDILTTELSEMRMERDCILEEKHQLSKDGMVLSSQLDEAHREVDRYKSDYDKVTKDYERLENAKLEQASRIDDLQTDLKNLSKDKELLEESFQKEKMYKENLVITVEELRTDAEKYKLEIQESAKNQIVIVHLREQNKLLSKDLEETKMQLQEKQTENEETRKKEQQMDVDHQETNQRLASEIEDLKTKLQISLEELGKSREAFDDLHQERQLTVKNLEMKLQDVQLQLTDTTYEQEDKQNKVVQLQAEVDKLKDLLEKKTSEMENIQQNYLQEQEDSQGKIQMVESDLSKKLEELKQLKQEEENNLVVQLDDLQKRYESVSVQLQAVIAEKTEAEAKLTLTRADCDQSKTLVSNLENNQKDLKEELRLVLAAKDDVSQKLVLTLQKLETVQLELLNKKATDGKIDEVDRDVEWEARSVHFQGSAVGRNGDGRSTEPSPRDFVVSLQNGKMSNSFENGDLDKSTQNLMKGQKAKTTEYQNGVHRSESQDSIDAYQDAGDTDKDLSFIFGKEKFERTSENTGWFQAPKDKAVQEKDKINSDLCHQLEQLKEENQDLRVKLELKQKEVLQLQHDATEARLSASSALTQLHVETKLRSILENKNSSLNSEVFKVYDDVKQLIKRSLILETNNQDLQSQLDQKTMSSSDSEFLRTQRSAQQMAEIRSSRERIVQAELEAERLKQQINSLVLKQNSAERDLSELQKLKPALAEAKNEAVQLRRRYEEEKMKTKLLHQTQNYMRQEINRLQSAGFNQTRQEKDVSKNSPSLCNLAAENNHLLQEVNDLKLALLSANERHELQQKKYEDRKHRIRTKFLRARELYNQERGQLKEQLSHLREDLLVARSMFNKEHELREDLDNSYKRLSVERRELLSKNSEQLQKIRELTRNLSMHEVQLKFLEDENKRLQEKVITANQRHSASLRANQKMIFQHQLSKDTDSLLLGTISGNLESVINRPLSYSENGMFSLLNNQHHSDKHQVINLNKDEEHENLEDSCDV
ncbi:unnamed protein product [Acanthosepion pharaonis]|uniref:Uncharacterized protein n=1 Tax=Acanthosepion pharaonis TaxID=158019 RepID=A0A812DE14_ACAPH|nr:unnamed protein product [Sepia pharaonis]